MLENTDENMKLILRTYYDRTRVTAHAAMETPVKDHLSLGTMLHFLEQRLTSEDRNQAIGHLAHCDTCLTSLTRTYRGMTDASAYWQQQEHLRWPVMLAHLAGMLTSDARKHVEEHTAACAECSSQLSNMSARFDKTVTSLRRFGLSARETLQVSVRWSQEAIDDVTGKLAPGVALAVCGESMRAVGKFGAAGAFGVEPVITPVAAGRTEADDFTWKIEEDANRRRRLRIAAQGSWLEANKIGPKGGVVQTLVEWTSMDGTPVRQTVLLALRRLGEDAYGMTAIPTGAVLTAGDFPFVTLEAGWQFPAMAAAVGEARRLNEQEDDRAHEVWDEFFTELPADTRQAIEDAGG